MNFVLEIEDVDGEAEHGSWREYMISSRSPPRSVRLICPAGVTEADFAKRVQLAVAALNDVNPIDRPELPPGWTDDPPTDELGYIRRGSGGLSYDTCHPPRARSRPEALHRAWESSPDEPWVDFADAQTRRAEAAEQALAMLTAERDELARRLERTQALYFEFEAELATAITVIEHIAPRPWEANLDDPHDEQDSGEYDDDEWVITDASEREIDRSGPGPSEPGHGVWARDYVATVNALGTPRGVRGGSVVSTVVDCWAVNAAVDERELARVGMQILEAAPLLVCGDDVIELDEDDVAVWEVLRDGTSTPTAIAGYITGDQRGLVALHFAQDDEAGWLEGQYNEILWVRRCKPNPEREPGQAIRVVVSRDPEAEREP